MKGRECGSAIVQSPVYEDSGVATSGELGEPSFSGECEGIASLRAPREPKGIEEDANPDPRLERNRGKLPSRIADERPGMSALRVSQDRDKKERDKFDSRNCLLFFIASSA